MKPLTDEVMQAIEDSDIKTNNHTLVGRIKKAVDTATSLEELKFVILALPSSNSSHGQSHTMNRVIKALQMEGLLPPAPVDGAKATTWAKVSRSAQQQTAVWNAVAGLFSQGKGEARAKVLESIPPVPVR